jgi:hypothetical protein
LNAIERATGRRRLNRLETHAPGGLEASTLHLAILGDLRRVNSHVSAIGYEFRRYLAVGAFAGKHRQPPHLRRTRCGRRMAQMGA